MVGAKRNRWLVAALAGLLVAAGCGNSTSSSNSGGHTFTVGIISDLSGPAASSNETILMGIKAGLRLAARDGYTIHYVVADTATNPATAQAAAKKLVEQNHVFAVLTQSALFFTAAPYLTHVGMPVIGAAEDGTEWTTSGNMFGVYGAVHPEVVTTTLGQFWKMLGVTTVGALGYSISPSSAEAAESAIKSAEAVGLKSGYLDASFPFGSTNVQPIALAMKNSGVDGLTATVDPNTGFALITALRNVGANPKVAVLPTGYGGDLLQAGPGALQAAQDVYFSSTFEPVEMHTAATEQFQSDLAAVGVKGDPTYAEYDGYLSVGLLVEGLQAAGSHPTQASLIAALSGIHNWTALGMLGDHPIDLSQRGVTSGSNCEWMTKLSGNTFDLIPGADPICGALVPGVTVSPPS